MLLFTRRSTPCVCRMPLQPEEVRGSETLNSFSKMLVEPYKPPEGALDGPSQISELEKEVQELKKRVKELGG